MDIDRIRTNPSRSADIAAIRETNTMTISGMRRPTNA